MKEWNKALLLSDEVRSALEKGAPVIALESTIISHGMPYPENVETALACERIARENGATPATCAILNGKLCAGLNADQLEHLGHDNKNVIKASRRDVPMLVAKGGDGGTTVSATMIVAAMAGIQVFATGGIGGVHRGAETSMDISADLEELAVTPVAVVCAGAKSILDLGLTLEYLETKGVPVIGYGTDELPAFYTRKSGLPVPFRLDTPKEVADAIRAQRSLGFAGGMLITNPVPAEHAMDTYKVEHVIQHALSEAKRKNVTGKELTPFLLDRIKQLTGGESLETNISLVENNVRLAARVAALL